MNEATENKEGEIKEVMNKYVSHYMRNRVVCVHPSYVLALVEGVQVYSEVFTFLDLVFLLLFFLTHQ